MILYFESIVWEPMAASFVVRCLSSADLDEVLSVHLELFEVKYSRRTIESFLGPTYLSLVLVDATEASQKIMGVSVSTRSWYSMCSNQTTAYLSTFGILPEYQRHGLGTYLFCLTCHILRSFYRTRELSLHMLRSKLSNYEFYTKLGLTAVRVIPQYYNIDGTEYDALAMSTDLVGILDEQNRSDISLSSDLTTLRNMRRIVRFWHPLFCNP
jgi:ribosomal protein S18 acetylase RimI-like enzyme